MTQKDINWIAIGIGLVFLLSLFSAWNTFTDEPVTMPSEIALDANSIALLQTVALNTAPSDTDEEATNSRADLAFDTILREDDEEVRAYDLALEELNSRDGKREIVKALNAEGENVESYRDIESIVVKDSDVNVNRDDAEVDFEIKVYYFNDDDSDDDERVSAKLEVTVNVEELDEDDNYEDAEAVEIDAEDFNFVKFYSNNR